MTTNRAQTARIKAAIKTLRRESEAQRYDRMVEASLAEAAERVERDLTELIDHILSTAPDSRTIESCEAQAKLQAAIDAVKEALK